MENQLFTEKRAFARFPIRIPVSYYSINSEGVINANTCDLSAIGVGMITFIRLPVGTEIELCIEMNDTGERIYTRGKVAWVGHYGVDGYKAGIKLEQQLRPIPIVLRTISYKRKYF